MRTGRVYLSSLFGLGVSALAFSAGAIVAVSASPAFMNPTLGQKETIQISVARPGSLSVLLLDRDGGVVRRLVTARPVEAETQWFTWDGRDDAGQIVADEAYSLRVELAEPNETSIYLPAAEQPGEVAVEVKGYDRRGGVLSYRLAAPARVHVQAGISRLDERTRKRDGPVLRTIANREPRPGGAVIENWDGYDETGSLYLPDLPHFAVAVAATSLPQNSIITVGNTGRSFVTESLHRTGTSLLPVRQGPDHAHHRGLSAADDVSPTLRIEPANATWSEAGRAWLVSEQELRVAAHLEGPTAPYFAKQPARLEIFVGDRRIREVRSPKDGTVLQLPIDDLGIGSHILAFNWSSDYGPEAVSAIRLEIRGRTAGSNDVSGGLK